MNNELLTTGVFVMLIGMGTVFVFLLIMIGMMYVNAAVLKFVNKYWPEEVEMPKTANKKSVGSNLDEIAVAIACAIKERGNNV